MSKHQSHVQIIGRRETINLPDLGAENIEAKIDTGAYRTALHCLSCRQIDEGDKSILEAIFDLDGSGPKTIYFDKFTIREVKNSFGQSEKRYCIRTRLRIGKRDIRSEVTLTDRSEMKYQVLLGRKTLLKKYLVDVNQIHVLSND